MKNLFEISEDEKRRILNLHENATKKQYLKEEGEGYEPWMHGDNPSGEPKNKLDLSSASDVNDIEVYYPDRAYVEGLGNIRISTDPLHGIYSQGQLFIEKKDGRQVVVPKLMDIIDGHSTYMDIRDLCEYEICGEKVWVPTYEEVGESINPKWVACQVSEKNSVLVPEESTQNVPGKVVSK